MLLFLNLTTLLVNMFWSLISLTLLSCLTESDDDEPAVPAVAKSGVKQVNFQLPNEDAKAEQDDDDDEDDIDDEDDDDSEDEEVLLFYIIM